MSRFDKHLWRHGIEDKPMFPMWESAWLLNRTTQSVRNYLASGLLDGLRIGERWAGVYRESLVKLIERGIR